MHLRVVFTRLHLGEDVGRGAGHDHHLDVVGLLESGQHLIGIQALHGSAVHPPVQRGFGLGRQRHECGRQGQA